MSTSPEQTRSGPGLSRSIPLLGVLGIAVALVGFLLGIANPEPLAAKSGSAAVRTEEKTSGRQQATVDAPAYNHSPASVLSPNRDFRTELRSLRTSAPGLFDPVHRTTEMKLAAIADRSANRAFDGAPPVIPHPVTQQSATNCLACHGDGLKIGDRVASKMSHRSFSSCTQCHVESAGSTPAAQSDVAANEFSGLYRAGPGHRALAGAPPTIPHSTWLRENCMSCHGLTSRDGLRTTHPWLSNCVQCHAPSARLDQVPRFPQ